MKLKWHNYRYYEYERELALREANALLSPKGIKQSQDGLVLQSPRNISNYERLVYFSGASDPKIGDLPTKQARLESIDGNNQKRQSTRYASHGLHEYKGKFNPQMARAILNLCNIKPGAIALDPFCGSGTSLVECSLSDISSIGMDINPLAVFLANAKTKALQLPAAKVFSTSQSLMKKFRVKSSFSTASERNEYLLSWFPKENIIIFEQLKKLIETHGAESTNILLAIASNLLRDYSLQEPHDLRIRRRKSPFPEVSILDAYSQAVEQFCSKLAAAQLVVGTTHCHSRAIRWDCKVRSCLPDFPSNGFDVCLTSPPYATALPYIDTQRLSLVWLDLLAPSEILPLEAELLGSREVRGGSKSQLASEFRTNRAGLPSAEIEFCNILDRALGPDDGFRRQLVPRLLYRYFAGMAESFRSTSELLKKDAPFALIVGGNHTVLGGKRYDIDTPQHLAQIAVECGWKHQETIPLQTYQRFGIHASNATTSEALIILRKK